MDSIGVANTSPDSRLIRGPELGALSWKRFIYKDDRANDEDGL
jgi:hypothetical protein